MDNLLKNRYRRNLVDMHIEDWSPEFLSKFSIDKYYDNIVRAKIQSSMVYLQFLCRLLQLADRNRRYAFGF